jgi:membrane complex biogenesis BtpA family protein
MSNWLTEKLHTHKPIIAMVHLLALPGDPSYDPQGGMAKVVERARADLRALQSGGVDAVMFSNEFSLPYLTKVQAVTSAAMARIIAELYPELTVPFGVNVLWDPKASLDLAVATGAVFVREIFTGAYASDFGVWNTNVGETIRHQHAISAQDVKLIFNIVPEAAMYMAPRNIVDIARSTVFNNRPDALAVSGLTAGVETDAQTLKQVKEAVPNTVVFANTGVKVGNVEGQLAIADGAIVGTAFKRDAYFYNEVQESNVRAFMDKVKAFRKNLT